MKPARDAAYLARVRRLQCRAPGCQRTAHHAHHSTVGRGMGQKASDYDAFGMCHDHHYQFHSGTGAFAGWDRNRRREWQLEQVSATQLTLGHEQCK